MRLEVPGSHQSVFDVCLVLFWRNSFRGFKRKRGRGVPADASSGVDTVEAASDSVSMLPSVKLSPEDFWIVFGSAAIARWVARTREVSAFPNMPPR